MEVLEEYGRNLGLSRDEVRQGLFLQRPELESLWVENGGSGGLGYQLLESGRYLEYECYDDSKKSQGRAIIMLEKWEDKEAGLFLGSHLKASDEYYEWYASQKLKAGECVYHMCDRSVLRCTVNLPRRDRREVVHMDRWRLLVPATMVECGVCS